MKLNSLVSEIVVGQQFQVDLLLGTQDETINALEGKIFFPEALLKLKEIRDGNSIINFWIEKPASNSQSEIQYSGITPGGYNDKKGLIFSIIFEAKKEGGDAIKIFSVKALLHDGKGTPADVRVSNFQFSISKQISPMPAEMPKIEDNDSPEEFQPEISQYPNIFNGEWFLVFVTQDKGSGIDHYEVQENRRQKIEDRRWEKAESPYILKDQKLKSYIYVEAVDKAGNERIATVEPKYPLKWYERWENWTIIIVAIIIVVLICRLVKKSRRNFGKLGI